MGEEHGPRLPSDVEREIFEVTARIDRRMCTTLVLVAKRVAVWITPVLYETALLDHQHPHENLMRHACHVRNLVLCGSLSRVGAGDLSHFTATTNLWLKTTDDNNPNLTSLLSGLSLKRLSIDFSDESLLDITSTLTVPSFQPPPWYANLTHLHLRTVLEWSTWRTLLKIPHLTHLATHFDRQTSDVCFFLRESKTLHLLVLFPLTMGDRANIPFHDPRLVHLPYTHETLKDWMNGAWGYQNFWQVAEDFALAREIYSLSLL
ncbi:hypothetical protein AX16_010841 [Volvariella volvacea WC 439]|nr:hypothetical protein AX16_010841 [Volvariella volvacea WC 439]